MKAKYIGDPAEGAKPNVPEEFTAHGVTFERNKWVDVPDDKAAKFAGNSHFETRGSEPEQPARPAPATPAA